MCFKYPKSNINTFELNATYCIIIIKMISCVWQTLDYLDIPPSNHPHSRVFCLPRFLIRFPTALINHSEISFGKFYFLPNSQYFLGEISNFHIDLLTEVTPQLTNNPCESLNAVLQNTNNIVHINYCSMVAGIHKFYYERRDSIVFFQQSLKKLNEK